MLYLITATYTEAHPFITRFHLKKESSHTRFQVFLSQETGLHRTGICLVVSGPGSIPAAIAVSSICTEYSPRQGDFLLNVGICAQIREPVCPSSGSAGIAGRIHRPAAPCQIGKIFLCNKLTERATGRTFYPDILYRHRFAEAPIVTGSKIYQKADTPVTDEENFCLYDMEAAAIYQAGAYFLGSHQMSFLKVISDYGSGGHTAPSAAEHLIDRNMDDISDYIANLRNISCGEPTDDLFQDENIRRQYEQLCRDLHCSKAMEDSLRQHIRYCILAGVDYHSVLKEMYLLGKLPCRDKREGKQRFEELRERLL